MTTRVNLTMREFGPELRKLGKAVPAASVKAMRGTAIMLRGLIISTIESTTPHKPVDTGAYRGAWQQTNVPEGAILANETPQSEWIERGRRPGPISKDGMDALAEWVRRKGLVGGEAATGRRFRKGSKKAKAHDAAVRQIAFLIARKLRTRGYEPRYPVRRTLMEHGSQLEAEIVRILTEKLG